MLLKINEIEVDLAPSSVVIVSFIFLYFHQRSKSVAINTFAPNVFKCNCEELTDLEVNELNSQINILYYDLKIANQKLSIVSGKTLVVTSLMLWKYNKFI